MALTMVLAMSLPTSLVSAAPPTDETEFYYGVEYDWNSVDTDLENFTGLNLPDIFSEFMGAADDAGFEMIIGQIMSGSSNIYVHYSEDVTPQTIKDVDDEDVNVWSRTNDVTIRHGGLVDGVFMTEWSEQNFGSDNPTGFDVDISTSVQNLLNVDMTYTEYLNDDYELVGADMAFSMETASAMGFAFDAVVEGNGDSFPVDFDLVMSYGYSITDSNSEWRLNGPSPIYTNIPSWDYGIWDCNIDDDCGIIEGDYDGSMDYSVSITGIPTEDFGFDEGEFDLEISDSMGLVDKPFSKHIEDVEVEFSMADSMVIDIGNGEGATTNVEKCETCPPGNPLMFLMMGEVITATGESFADEIADEFSNDFGEEILNLFGLELDNDDDDWDEDWDEDEEQQMFTCANGDEIDMWRVGDYYYDCGDRSDEGILRATSGIYYFEELTGGVTVWNANTGYSGISCDNQYVSYNAASDFINNGVPDCNDGSDEPQDYDDDGDIDNYFICEEGGAVTIDKVMDGNDDCAQGSDEGKDTYYYELDMTLSNEDGTLLKTRNLRLCPYPDETNSNCDYQLNGNHIHENVMFYPEDGEHDEVVCFDWELRDESQVLDGGNECITTGVQWDYLWLYQMDPHSTYLEIDGQLFGTGGSNADGYSIDFTLKNSAQEVIWYHEWSSISNWYTANANIPESGEYCLQAIMKDDSGVVVDTKDVCTNVEIREHEEEAGDLWGIEFSEKLKNIGDAMGDSNLQNILETFGENLRQRLDNIEPLEQFPYQDGGFASMWSDEHATIVGVGLYADDDSGSYVMAGPTTQGYDSNPPTKMSIRYLTGVDAKNAAESMEDKDEIDEMVNMDEHNLDDIIQDLQDSGIDTSGLDLETPNVNLNDNSDNSGNSDNSDNSEEEEPSKTEEKADDDGLLPFVSPIAVLAVIALAGAVFGSKQRD